MDIKRTAILSGAAIALFVALWFSRTHRAIDSRAYMEAQRNARIACEKAAYQTAECQEPRGN